MRHHSDGITPRNDSGARDRSIIDKINLNISKFADGKTIRYLNINDNWPTAGPPVRRNDRRPPASIGEGLPGVATR